jgi:hypothetical protein
MKKAEKGYNVNVFMSSKIRIDNAIGMFTADAKGKPLEIKKSGNGAVIPFLKRYIGKKAIVFIIGE